MTWGIPTATFLQIHVAISLIEILRAWWSVTRC